MSRARRIPLIALLGAALAMLLAIGCNAQEQSPPKLVAPGGRAEIAQGLLQQAVRRYGHRSELTLGMQVMLGENCRAAAPCYSCVTCHGVRGAGSAGPGIPRLTGQSDLYLDHALRSFASGRRASDVMQPVAKQLTGNEMRAVAEWYAAQTPAVALPVPGPLPQEATLARGGKIAAVGSAKARVQGCANCHGPAGAGEPPIFPYLAGQYPHYLEQQLTAFKQGTRRDPGHIMQGIATQLDGADIDAVAEYFGSMQPPIHLQQVGIGEGLQGAGRPASSSIVGSDPPPDPPKQPHKSRQSAPVGASGAHASRQARPGEGRLIAFGGQFGQLQYSCASCHQLDGTGDPSGAFPRLAQQKASYIYQSLREFASGARKSAVMQPIAQELSDEQMHSVAAFYSTLRPQPFPPVLPPDKAAISRGRKIAAHGITPKGPGCDSCHGRHGDASPYLAGQYASYLEQQLKLFKSHKRRGQQAIIMQTVVGGMTEAQMRDVSLYFASRRPRFMATANVLRTRHSGRAAPSPSEPLSHRGGGPGRRGIERADHALGR